MPTHIHKHKDKQKSKNNVFKKKHKQHDSDSASDESYKKKVTDDDTTSSDSSVVEKKEKRKTKNGKHNNMSIVPDIPIDIEKESNKKKKRSNDSKFKIDKRIYVVESSEDECQRKRAKREREREGTNIGSNVGTSEEDLELELPEVKFTIVHLNEEEMLKNREIDRNGRIFKARAFKCESCIMGFASKIHYEKHKKEKHSKLVGKLRCPICNTRFVKKGFLKLHQDNHYRSYKCRLCDFEHHRRYVIDSHVVKEHDLKPSPVCLACDIEFDSKLLLINHYETAHEEVLKCDSVEPFNTDAKVKENNNEVKEQDETSNTENAEIMKCSLCKFRTFDGKSSYRAHMQFSHRTLAEKAYCIDCDLQFSSVHKYKRHLDDSKKHNQVENLILNCVHCNSEFPNKASLLAHTVRAHRLLSHSCALCNKGFSDADRLKNHIEAKHPDVIKSPKEKKCPICSKESVDFFDPDNLQKHIQKKHPDDIKSAKDKKCPICSKGFIARSALLNHIRTHTAEKPFQCRQCKKRFAVKAMLNKHIQRMHQEDDDNN